MCSQGHTTRELELTLPTSSPEHGREVPRLRSAGTGSYHRSGTRLGCARILPRQLDPSCILVQTSLPRRLPQAFDRGHDGHRPHPACTFICDWVAVRSGGRCSSHRRRDGVPPEGPDSDALQLGDESSQLPRRTVEPRRTGEEDGRSGSRDETRSRIQMVRLNLLYPRTPSLTRFRILQLLHPPHTYSDGSLSNFHRPPPKILPLQLLLHAKPEQPRQGRDRSARRHVLRQERWHVCAGRGELYRHWRLVGRGEEGRGCGDCREGRGEARIDCWV